MPAFPNLVTIGAMKCGTTSLHSYLSRHPQIQMSQPKELDFFAGNNAGRGIEWYKSLFDASYPVRGESSQNYSKRHHPNFASAMEHMARAIPKAKLVYLVRDPIERYKSHVSYNFFNEDNVDNLWAAESDHYFKTGLYHWQLEHVLVHYPQEQLLVIDAEDLEKHRYHVMSEIFDFLKLTPVANEGQFDFRENEHGETRVPVNVRRNPFIRFCNKLAPGFTSKALASQHVQSRFMNSGGKKSLTEDQVDRLKERYASDVERLRSLTGKSFSGWSV